MIQGPGQEGGAIQFDEDYLPTLQSDVCRGLAAAWLGWRGDDLLPGRRDMRLEDVRTILSFISVYEVPSAERIVIRLAASAQEAMFDGSLQGINVLDITVPEDRPLRSARTWQMVTRPCGGRSSFLQPLRSGLESPVELLSLPIRPARWNQPMQLLTALAPMPGPIQHDTPQPRSVFHVARDFEFLDLGAGVPDSAGGEQLS